MPAITWLLISWGLGVVLATSETIINMINPCWGLWLALAFLLAGLVGFWRGKRKTPLLLILSLFSAGYGWGGIGQPAIPQSLQPFLGHYLRGSGVVAAQPQLYPNRLVCTLAEPEVWLGPDRWQGQEKLQLVYYFPVEEATGTGGNLTGGHMSARQPDPRLSLLPGSRVTFNGRFDLAPEGLNPGDFNYRAWLLRKGIVAQLRAQELPQLLPGTGGWSYVTTRYLTGVRLRLEQSIDQALPSDQADALKGYLLGATEGLTAEDQELYQRTGVMHLFAVSGLNIGFELLLLMGIASLLRCRKTASFALVTVGLWGYTALIAFPPSAVRAVVMGTLGAAAYLWSQRQHLLHSLVLAAVVIILADPAALLDPGFQLSFVATWGIIYLAAPISSHLPLPRWVKETVAVALSAQLAVIPLTALYFQQLPLLSLLANLVVVPLSGLVVITGLAGMLLALIIPWLGAPFYWTAGAVAVLIRGTLVQLSQLPGNTITVQPPGWLLIIVCYLILLLLGWSLQQGFEVRLPHFCFRPPTRGWISLSLVLLLLSGFTLAWGWGAGGSRGLLRVHFISVGQGDAILIQLPNGHNLLVDSGGKPAFSQSSFDPGRQIVLPYLARQGVTRLDLLVNSHPHEDHLGGVPAVLEQLDVGGLMTARVTHPTPLMLQVDKIARERGIPVLLMGRGGAIQLDPRVRIEVLNPPVSLYTGTHSDLNNNSLVLKVSYGDVSLLLTGDIEQDAMQGLVRYLGSSRAGELRATVLKLPHHGSKYSLYDDFARLVQPQYVVISVGPNSFGHPAPETLAFWSERGAQILRTDQDGALVFETDGQQLVLKTGKTQGSRILKDRGLSTATGYLTGDNVSLRN